MATYYVGAGGNNSNDGLSWAQRKLTLNGAEDIPVAAGDTVYVGPGTYREQLTCDVSGSSGSPITYIGDYDGSHTDGTGGVVRITGSDDDLTLTRGVQILVIKDYRTFKGFTLDGGGSHYGAIYAADANVAGLTVEQCYIISGAVGIRQGNKAFTGLIVRNCYFSCYGEGILTALVVDNSNNLIENCIFTASPANAKAAISIKEGGTTIKNCTINGCYYGIALPSSLNAGQTVTVNNCTFNNCFYALRSATLGNLVENYNNFYTVEIARTNVNVGANSTAYLNLFDTRWFFEMVNGGSMLTPFDLASYSPLVDLAGTTPSTADMRGTTVKGTQREWGALEYDSTLDIEAGSGGAVSIQPTSGRISL